MNTEIAQNPVYPAPTPRRCQASVTRNPTLPPDGIQPRSLNDELQYLVQPVDNEWLKDGLPDTDFNRKYPPDAWGEETSDNARIWKLYRDYSGPSDERSLAAWNKTLDVLLIFAGLFSAVLTAFLIESLKNLQPDNLQYIAALLYTLHTSDSSSGFRPTHAGLLSPDQTYHATLSQRFTNGLWFMSLFISLTVALLSILLKQWLDEYESRISESAPSPKYWARRHQLYSSGLRAWGLPALISCLPLLLHISVFLFFLGLVLFLHPLDATIAHTLLVLVFAMFSVYVASVLMPTWRIDCPSYTPLLRQLPALANFFLAPIRRCAEGLRFLTSDHTENYVLLRFTHNIARRVTQGISFGQISSSRWTSSLEAFSMRRQRDRLDGCAFRVLLDSTRDRDVTAAGVEAFGTLSQAAAQFARGSSFETALLFSHRRTQRDTGAGAASYARRVRAHFRVATALDLPSHGVALADLSRTFGLDGAILNILGRLLSGSADRISSLVQFVPHIIAIYTTTSRTQTIPVHRSICELFLSSVHRFSRVDIRREEVRSLTLLLFCAGNFSRLSGDELGPDRDRALLAISRLAGGNEEGSPTASSQALPLRNGFNSLCRLLADSQRYSLVDGMDRLLAEHLVHLIRWSWTDLSRTPWSDLEGFADWVRSPFFAENVADDFGLREQVFELIHSSTMPVSDLHRLQFWESIAVLGKAGCHVSLQAFSVSKVFPGRKGDDLMSVLIADSHEIDLFLRAFLTGNAPISTWPWESLLVYDAYDLAKVIAQGLCYRVRRNIGSTDYVQTLFSGRFLLAQFNAELRDGYWKRETRWKTDIIAFAKHCVKLSPSSWLQICSRLQAEITACAKEDTLLAAFMLRRLDELRTALTRDGDLCGECDEKCLCRPAKPRRTCTLMPRREKGLGNAVVSTAV